MISKFASILRPRSRSEATKIDYDTKTRSSRSKSEQENTGDGNNLQSQQKILSRASLSRTDLVEYNIRILHRIADAYEYSPTHDLINDGASAKVYRVRRVSDGQIFALKLIPVSKALHRKLFLSEISTLRRLNHPSIIRLVEAVIDMENYGLVLPLCTGGSLTSLTETPLPEKETAKLITQILDTISYLHSRNIVHRDLKPDNFVFEDETRSSIMLIDLADAIFVERSANYTDIAGTLLYWAPEVFRQRLGSELFAGDVWSVGVITFELLTGSTPFDDPSASMKKIMANIFMNRYEMPQKFSQEAQEFIQEMLNPRAGKRISARDAMGLPFLGDSAVSLRLNHIHVSTPSWSAEEEE